jgi:hypothetical protein
LIDYLQYKLYNLETVQRSKIQKTNILFIIWNIWVNKIKYGCKVK